MFILATSFLDGFVEVSFVPVAAVVGLVVLGLLLYFANRLFESSEPKR